MKPIHRLLNLITNSFLFLTCSTIVEGLKLTINTRIVKIDPKSSLILYTAIPIVCISITVMLILYTDSLSVH